MTCPGLPRDADGGPFAALAAACDDVKHAWEPFKEKLLEEGRRLGICRERPWARPMLFRITVPVAILAVLVPIQVWHVSIAAALAISVISVFLF